MGGGIDPQHLLPFASCRDTREHVRRNMAAFKPAGGYVFNHVHHI
jgi:uroporphyrinogen decarboxylase